MFEEIHSCDISVAGAVSQNVLMRDIITLKSAEAQVEVDTSQEQMQFVKVISEI